VNTAPSRRAILSSKHHRKTQATNMSWGGDSGNAMRMDVPNSYIGRIIGRGGSRIRELQDDSGCRINIIKNEATSDSTPVELQGSESCQQHAKQLIDDILNEQQSYGGGGGGSRGGDRYGGGGRQGGGGYGGGGRSGGW